MACPFTDVPGKVDQVPHQGIELGGEVPGPDEESGGVGVQGGKIKEGAPLPDGLEVQIVVLAVELPVAEVQKTVLVLDAENRFQMGSAGGGIRLRGAEGQGGEVVRPLGLRETGGPPQGGHPCQQGKEGVPLAGAALPAGAGEQDADIPAQALRGGAGGVEVVKLRAVHF